MGLALEEGLTRHKAANMPTGTPVVYGPDHPIGMVLGGLQAVKDTSDHYLHGKDPMLKTTDELTNKKFDTTSDLTPAVKEYMAKRDYIFTAKNLSPELISDAIQARVTELEDTIQRSPLKSAAERDGNTLGNLLELTLLAQKELSGEMKSKSTLKKVMTDIIAEEAKEIEYVATNATKTGMIHDRNGKAIAFQVLDSDQKQVESNLVQYKREKFNNGKDRLQEFVKSL